jgi:hypothetical protein
LPSNYLIPLPPSPEREGGKPMFCIFLAPPPWGRGWGEVSGDKINLILHNKNKFCDDFFFFRKYVVFLQTSK